MFQFEFLKSKRTKKPQLPEQIKIALKCIEEEIPSINCGGCGILTYALLKKLQEVGYINSHTDWSIVFLHCGESRTYKWNLKALDSKDTSRVPKSCYHILLRIEDFVYDSEICENYYDITQSYYDIIESKSINKLLLAINHSEWNEEFDRFEDVPTIEYHLGVKLPEIKTSWDVKTKI